MCVVPRTAVLTVFVGNTNPGRVKQTQDAVNDVYSSLFVQEVDKTFLELV